MKNPLLDLMRQAARAMRQATRTTRATTRAATRALAALKVKAPKVPKVPRAKTATRQPKPTPAPARPPRAVTTAVGKRPAASASPRADAPLPGRPANDHTAPALRQRLGTGDFSSGLHTHASLKRHYKLYVPAGLAGQRVPLVVMLHGCTQDPDDFAAGTGMNEQADAQRFCVLYPAQAQEANPSRCWNWFKHSHQQRGRGEPALIADLTLSIIKAHGLDPKRVYIAGLSAGGAMAAIVAAAYPELYAAVGVHSGLAPGAASNLVGAMTAMRTGATGPHLPWLVRHSAHTATIVFHGDEDRTVHPRNGEQVIAAVLNGSSTGEAPSAAAIEARLEHGVSAHGRRYTRATHHAAKGKTLAEHWLVHGAGHAWSGGHAAGSYTDASGPDATREMLRFFFEQ